LNGGLGTGVLAAAKFVLGAAANAAGAQIIYNSATGNIFYDSDGNAALNPAKQFAHVNAGTVLTDADFFVV
jgi:serralysin